MSSNIGSDDWYIACSDDEKYKITGCSKGKLEWTPKPEKIVALLQAFDKV